MSFNSASRESLTSVESHHSEISKASSKTSKVSKKSVQSKATVVHELLDKSFGSKSSSRQSGTYVVEKDTKSDDLESDRSLGSDHKTAAAMRAKSARPKSSVRGSKASIRSEADGNVSDTNELKSRSVMNSKASLRSDKDDARDLASRTSMDMTASANNLRPVTAKASRASVRSEVKLEDEGVRSQRSLKSVRSVKDGDNETASEKEDEAASVKASTKSLRAKSSASVKSKVSARDEEETKSTKSLKSVANSKASLRRGSIGKG